VKLPIAVILLYPTILLLAGSDALAQSSADFAVLAKRLEQMESKIDRLEKENQRLCADMEPATHIGDKLKVSEPVTEMKLYGDLRLRYSPEPRRGLRRSPR